MAGSCNAASGSLVDVDIPKLSESPWPGIDIFWETIKYAENRPMNYAESIGS